jgi:hypothetical protein
MGFIVNAPVGPSSKGSQMPKSSHVMMVCAKCGSPDVLCDAYAEWDLQDQKWVLQNTFDKGAFCENCDGECRIIEREITDEEGQ